MAKTRDALSVQQGQSRKGLQVRRLFTTEDAHPYDELTWERRDAVITNWRDGSIAFEQRDLDFPTTWSQNATNIVAQKYFRGPLGTPQREHSVRQMVDRVAGTVTNWGIKDGYFAGQADAEAFRSELTHLLVNQRAAFNSPVWFNVGVEPHPQCSACQPYDALVSTPTGMIPIGELVERGAVGTVVYDARGETRVRAVKFNGSKRVYRVRLRNGSFIEATGDHLVFAASKRRSSGAWLRVDELRPGLRLHLYPHRASSDDVVGRLARTLEAPELRGEVGGGLATLTRAETETREAAEAALAGWLQADGFVGQYQTGTNTSLTIEFMTVGEEEHDWVQRQLQAVFPDTHQHVRTIDTADQGKVGRRIRLCGEVLRPFVEAWGLMARRHDLRVPTRLWTASNEVVAAYLRSVFQADGYVTVQGGSSRVAVGVISEAWTEDLQVLLLRLGIYSRRLRKREARADRSDLHEVLINLRSERSAFAQRIGFISEDKAQGLEASLGIDGKSCTDLREEEILAVEDRGVQRVYDIQTDSGEYLSNNVRVHNCFILSVEDTMPSILNWYVEEGLIFKGGSGAGINLSTIRSSKEPLGNGGEASGPVSFMRGADASAGTIKSGGKCFREGTLVATPDGMQPIERLRVGDKVLTHKGPRAVADFMPNGRRQCYRVRTREGYEVEVTAGHKFAYWNSVDGHFDVKPIEEFKPGDGLYALLEPSVRGATIPLLPPEIADPARATTTVEMSLPTELDERLAYVLGLMYGDGELRTKYPYRVRVAFAKDAAGRMSAQRFRDYSKGLFGEEPLLLGDASGHQQLGFTRKRLVDFLVVNGIAKGRAEALGLPGMLFRAEPGVRAAFIAGVIDADGSYHRRGGWSVSSIDRAFLVDLQRLLLTLGVPAKLKLSRESNGTWRTLYRLQIVGHTFIQRLVEHIKPHSAKAQITYVPSPGADKGWGYRPSLPGPLASRVTRRGGHRLIERSVGMNETSGYGAVATLVRHPEVAVAGYAEELSTCVQLTLEAVIPTEVAETYDIEVEDAHLLSANGIYASNTRRAAKMVVLNVNHPDVRDFIWCKAREEHKARVLRDSGFDMDLDGRDSISIQYQNANNSVRVTDEFMHAYEDDHEFDLKAVLDGHTVERTRARDLMREIAQAAWECADPGMQYDTVINDWHTTPESGRINASNPCSEYMHLDNSACNLASLNLLKFLGTDGVFDVEAFKHAVEVVFLAQEIIVGNSSYPTDKITRNAKDYRQLGLGYANLGALLMAQGQPYDSDGGRAWAGAITALMTGHAYRTSARIAQVLGPFAGHAKNRAPMLRVIGKHRKAVDDIDASLVQPSLIEAAKNAWDEALQFGTEHGFRNAQASVIAPTGTIGLLMDCDTTGIEPDLALVKTKKLVGGGSMSIVNQTVPKALSRLGYADEHVQAILEYIAEHNSVKGAPALREEHYPVFDCAMGDSPIHYMGHIRMMAAVQPFISGAISKTVNMPESVSVEEVEKAYHEGWKLGLKALAIYRDNCKVGQPLSVTRSSKAEAPAGSTGDKRIVADSGAVIEVENAPVRRRLPRTRPSKTTSFRVGDIEGYLTAGSYPDDGLGEIFVKVSKQGSTLSGVMDAFAIAVSLGLQYGVPLEVYVSKFSNMIFEPNGITDDPDVRITQSLVDYIARRLAIDYLDVESRQALGIKTTAERIEEVNGNGLSAQASEPAPASTGGATSGATAPTGAGAATAGGESGGDRPTDQAGQRQGQSAVEGDETPTATPASPRGELAFTPGMAAVDAPFCSTCGVRMRPAGSCFVCESCGTTSGCS